MSIVVPADVGESVARHIATGRYQSSDEVLRSAMQALAEFDEDLVAVQQAIHEWHAGDAGVPLDEAIQLIQQAEKPGGGQ